MNACMDWLNYLLLLSELLSIMYHHCTTYSAPFTSFKSITLSVSQSADTLGESALWINTHLIPADSELHYGYGREVSDLEQMLKIKTNPMRSRFLDYCCISQKNALLHCTQATCTNLSAQEINVSNDGYQLWYHKESCFHTHLILHFKIKESLFASR